MSDTRHHIIELADRLIRQKGFNAFSYTDISEPLAIRNAAVHYYFPAKSDLGVAVVEAELDRLRRYQREYGHWPGDEQLKILISTFGKNSQLHLICLMGSLTPDYDTFDDPLRQKVKEMCILVLEWVTGSLEKARAEGGLRFEGMAADRALLVVSALASSLLLARVLGEAVFGKMLDQLLQDMEAKWRTGDLNI